MRINYKNSILFIFFFLGTLVTQANSGKDSISAITENQLIWEIITIEAKGENLSPLSHIVSEEVVALNPNVVFLLAGVNGRIHLEDSFDEKNFKATYQEMISKLRAEEIETVLFNLPPPGTNHHSGLSAISPAQQLSLKKANEIIKSLSEKNHLKLIDINSAYPNNEGIFNTYAHLALGSEEVLSKNIHNRIVAEQAYYYLKEKNKTDEKLTLVFLGGSKTQISNTEENPSPSEGSIQYHLEKIKVGWQKLAPYFTVPAKYKGIKGTFKDPFIFEDKSKVSSLEDWKNRREEILSAWHAYMGEWPEIIENPNYEVLSSINKSDYIQKKIRFEWVPGQMTDGYLLVPYQANNLPAVVTVYYEPETAIGEGKEQRDFALQLVKRGFVTLSIGTTETTENKTYSLYYPHIDSATVEPLSLLAYAAANAWHLLADLPEVNKEKIGIMGHSYGGKWAMFASCLFENFAAAVWSDPGIVFDQKRPSINYWEPWYLGYHPRPRRERGVPNAENPARGTYLQLLKDNRDLHELHVLMAPRPFLVSGGEEDGEHRWIPLNHSIKANKLYGYSDRVGMSNRPEHSPNPESNAIIYNFFDYFLKQ